MFDPQDLHTLQLDGEDYAETDEEGERDTPEVVIYKVECVGDRSVQRICNRHFYSHLLVQQSSPVPTSCGRT